MKQLSVICYLLSVIGYLLSVKSYQAKPKNSDHQLPANE